MNYKVCKKKKRNPNLPPAILKKRKKTLNREIRAYLTHRKTAVHCCSGAVAHPAVFLVLSARLLGFYSLPVFDARLLAFYSLPVCDARLLAFYSLPVCDVSAPPSVPDAPDATGLRALSPSEPPSTPPTGPREFRMPPPHPPPRVRVRVRCDWTHPRILAALPWPPSTSSVETARRKCR